MTLQERIEVLVRLGDLLASDDELMHAVMHRTYHNNQWFTIENQRRSARAIARQFLQRDKLESWLAQYGNPDVDQPRRIGLVLAGNIPLVGFHDLLSVFACGHRAQIKPSDKDRFMIPFLLKKLQQYDARTVNYFEVVERLRDFDAVIATGSNNSARYFRQYFGKYPHIIRRNRNAVAVLGGAESNEELRLLGEDVFRYFGLGCRNVSKLYVPQGYDFEPLLETLYEYREIILNNKYKNNFDYHYAIATVNRADYKSNGCLILTENTAISSHIAGLYYETYSSTDWVEQELRHRAEDIQLVVARDQLLSLKTVPFGQAQQPDLMDYADGVDTMAFLLALDR